VTNEPTAQQVAIARISFQCIKEIIEAAAHTLEAAKEIDESSIDAYKKIDEQLAIIAGCTSAMLLLGTIHAALASQKTLEIINRINDFHKKAVN